MVEIEKANQSVHQKGNRAEPFWQNQFRRIIKNNNGGNQFRRGVMAISSGAGVKRESEERDEVNRGSNGDFFRGGS